MRGAKYFWQNDYKDGTPLNYIETKKVAAKPTKASLEALSFSRAYVEPIVETIIAAIRAKGNIAVVGDYDMDGVSASVIMLKALKLLGTEPTYYMPNRFTDGYGINAEMVERLHAQGVSCIITVDNGIVAFDAARKASELGLTLIITDHHARDEILPDATHIVHPALDAALGGNEISGAAVAYLLTKALVGRHEAFATLKGELIQLAALGTIADMMPLEQVWNRSLTYHGFQLMRTQPLPLLKAFLRLQEKTLPSSDDISFQFIPTINAVGRLADVNVVVEAFLSADEQKVGEWIAQFQMQNVERKQMSEMMYETILTQLSEEERHGDGFLLVVGEALHQGVLGLIAQRLMQHLSRPVIVLTPTEEDKTVYTGSARAFGKYNVKSCLDRLAPFLVKGGGHQHAGGLSVAAAMLEQVRKTIAAYNDEVGQTLELGDKMLPLTIDAWLPLATLGERFLQGQDKFAPYGEGNKKFVIGIKGAKLLAIQPLGTTGKHVKLRIEAENKTYQIVAFHMFDLAREVALYTCVDLALEVQRNYFNGTVHIQYLLVDLRVPQKQVFDLRAKIQEHTDIAPAKDVFIVEAIPLDKAAFLQLVAGEQIKRIYLPPVPFENEQLYTVELDKKYFNLVYNYMQQKEKVDLTDKALYEQLLRGNVPKSIFLYILNVFSELNFVIIESNMCRINSDAQKTSLNNSTLYRKMPEWLALRTALLTGTVDTLYETLAIR